MSLLTAMSSANTGLESASTELSIISDNIANANTIGFKAERAAFEDAPHAVDPERRRARSAWVPASRRCSGSSPRAPSPPRASTRTWPCRGPASSCHHGTHGGQEGEFFTRAGQFNVDKDGFLVNLDGLRVQGFPADPSGVVSTIPGDLLVGNAQANPIPTSAVTMKGNLQSNAAVIAAPWDPLNPSATSNFATSMTVYDALGSRTRSRPSSASPRAASGTGTP